MAKTDKASDKFRDHVNTSDFGQVGDLTVTDGTESNTTGEQAAFDAGPATEKILDYLRASGTGRHHLALFNGVHEATKNEVNEAGVGVAFLVYGEKQGAPPMTLAKAEKFINNGFTAPAAETGDLVIERSKRLQKIREEAKARREADAT